MSELHDRPRWTRHFVRRSERLRTTWTLRVGLAVLCGLLVWLTQGWWIPAVGHSLICAPASGPADAMLIENFDQDAFVFRHAAAVRRAGHTGRVFVPVAVDPETSRPDEVKLRVTGVMADMVGLGEWEPVPIREVEPISLNAALDVRRVLEREAVSSVVVVSPRFRSRRSALVYSTAFAPAGIEVSCEPAPAPVGPDDWTDTWHGIQEVLQQWIKFRYYEWYVMRTRVL
jgi:hypothetical protein